MPDPTLDLSDPDAVRERALSLAHTGHSGSSAAGLVLATLYVGDQIRRLANGGAPRAGDLPLPRGERIARGAATLADHADEIAGGLELRDDALPVALRPVTDAIRELADVVETHAAAPADTAHPPF